MLNTQCSELVLIKKKPLQVQLNNNNNNLNVLLLLQMYYNINRRVPSYLVTNPRYRYMANIQLVIKFDYSKNFSEANLYGTVKRIMQNYVLITVKQKL